MYSNSNSNKNFKSDFVICPACNGKSNPDNALCIECLGLGVGIFYNGYFLYWKQKYNKKVVKFNEFKRNADKIFNASLVLASSMGFITLLIWISQKLIQESVNLDDLIFWEEKHIYIFLFWCSIAFIMYAYFRYSTLRAFHIIKELKQGASELPNNWGELTGFNEKYKIDVASGFSKKALQTIEKAFSLAETNQHPQMLNEHLLLALLKDKTTLIFLKRLNIDVKKLTLKVENQLLLIQRENNSDYTVTINKDCKKSLIETYLRVYSRGDKQVYPINFLLSIHIHDEDLSAIFYNLELDEEKINNCIEWFRIDQSIQAEEALRKQAARFNLGDGINKAAICTPILDHYSKDYTRAAKLGKFEYCVDREDELKEIFTCYADGKKACLLVGNKGIGKTTIIKKITKSIIEETTPKILQEKRLLELDLARLIEEVKASEVQERILVLFDEARKAGNIILYIKDIEKIAGIETEEGDTTSTMQILADTIASSKVLVIATTKKDTFKNFLEGKALGNVFNIVEVNEPKGNIAIQILMSKASKLELKYKIFFTYGCLEQIVYLSNKYIKNRSLPEKAIKILNSLSAEVLKEKGDKSLATKVDASQLISSLTGIPINELGQDESQKLLNFEKIMRRSIIGQDWAIKSISTSLRRSRAELGSQSKPIASFLFVGSFGVGKTQVANTVAQIYFGSKDNIIKLDMNNYQDMSSIDKLVGTADGELGYITERIKKSPSSLILLNEFEKAHPRVSDLFLQILNEGKINDASGSICDFTNSIIIATTNTGSEFIQEQVSIGTSENIIKEEIIELHLNKQLKQDIISKFSQIIIFKPLTLDDVVNITSTIITQIKLMLNKKGINLEVSKKGIERLAKDGFDPIQGVNLLRTLIQERIENKIAGRIIAGTTTRGDTVTINAQGNIDT
ncbi:ATP-dependent Clp protease ATP-binding subunit [Patescibacteria group bacterium]|nr:ATP-dependent Clp protease ATP-binding subunit [Patescibacteria group bacterium]